MVSLVPRGWHIPHADKMSNLSGSDIVSRGATEGEGVGAKISERVECREAWQVCAHTCQSFGSHAFPADAKGCHSRRAVGTADCPHAFLLPRSGPQPAKAQAAGYAMHRGASSIAAILDMLA